MPPATTPTPSLHRLQPRRALETTAYGYEVVADAATLSACIDNVRWVDCWCPDAAQFILLDAPPELARATGEPLFEAIAAAHLGDRIRLVCAEAHLADDGLVAALEQRGIGVLLGVDRPLDIAHRGLTDRGVLGLRLGPGAVRAAGGPPLHRTAWPLVRQAHELGLRVVASQLPEAIDAQGLFALGVDYVSRPGDGLRPGPTDGFFEPARPRSV